MPAAWGGKGLGGFSMGNIGRNLFGAKPILNMVKMHGIEVQEPKVY